MMMIDNQVTCSPDSKGNFGVVTETFTVGTKSVQVILMLPMLILVLTLDTRADADADGFDICADADFDIRPDACTTKTSENPKPMCR